MLDSSTAILQALMRGESYGLEIIERVRDSSNGRIVLRQGRVYPLLRSLESEGLLRSFDRDGGQERAGRPRRYYELTAEGRRAATDDAAAIAGLIAPFAPILGDVRG